MIGGRLVPVSCRPGPLAASTAADCVEHRPGGRHTEIPGTRRAGDIVRLTATSCDRVWLDRHGHDAGRSKIRSDEPELVEVRADDSGEFHSVIFLYAIAYPSAAASVSRRRHHLSRTTAQGDRGRRRSRRAQRAIELECPATRGWYTAVVDVCSAIRQTCRPWRSAPPCTTSPAIPGRSTDSDWASRLSAGAERLHDDHGVRIDVYTFGTASAPRRRAVRSARRRRHRGDGRRGRLLDPALRRPDRSAGSAAVYDFHRNTPCDTVLHPGRDGRPRSRVHADRSRATGSSPTGGGRLRSATRVHFGDMSGKPR